MIHLTPAMSLPAEVCNLIFDACISDRALMATWGLVSRQYLVSSRFHIFSTVRLDYGNAHEFADILSSPSCDIALLVQHLMFSHRASRYSWFPDVLPRLPPFPNVMTLCLHNSRSVLTEDLRDLLRVGLPGVTRLEIVNFRFAYRAAAIDFACGFAALQALAFLPRIASALATATPAQIPSTLRSLALRCSVEEQPNWLLAELAQPSAPALTTLRVGEAGARDFPGLVRALGRQGQSLTSFALDFSDTIVEVAFLRNYFLEPNTALRYLELTLGSTVMVELCVGFLSKLGSPVLEELVLDIWVDPAHFSEHPWEVLDAVIMSGPASATMRRVELRIGALITWAPLAQSIRARMPACEAWGLLCIRVDGEEC
ncbi:hypothetical protein DFH07DRAFT_936709 [Mycena maculata]|uniref:F-box domain-containing protein n=1 Tax=Mycena maculata TaxID=230809 RepID=A0AAD7K3U4_9AGAR|nr:hypothetical protein DFH07DRAFT_936709 [Mycena maculata]